MPDWYWWKAQLYQESLLDPNAVSPAGAEGIAQFMPGTWEEISRRLGYGGLSRRDADHAIDFGAYYMARLSRGWKFPRPVMDRHYLALSSYNAGFGNILAAQRACGGALLYAAIIECLPSITGRHSNETITYVQRIRRWRRELYR